jgi:CBS domain-containing protein
MLLREFKYLKTNSMRQKMDEKENTITQFYETLVKDIMSTSKTKIPHATDDVDITDVLSLLTEYDHIWIMDCTEPTLLVGVISESDTLAFFSPPLTTTEHFESPDSRSLQFGQTVTAAEIMEKKPVTVAPDETLRESIVKMKEHKIKHLPVVDESGQLIGEISLHHIIKEYTDRYPKSTKTT